MIYIFLGEVVLQEVDEAKLRRKPFGTIKLGLNRAWTPRAQAKHRNIKESQSSKHDLYTSGWGGLHEADKSTTPVHVSALTTHHTLYRCRFERSRSTKHYTCAGLSAREPPDTTPVHVSALTEHQTLHLCRFCAPRSVYCYSLVRFARQKPSREAIEVALSNFHF